MSKSSVMMNPNCIYTGDQSAGTGWFILGAAVSPWVSVGGQNPQVRTHRQRDIDCAREMMGTEATQTMCDI